MGCASSKKQTRSDDDIPGSVAKESGKPLSSAPANKSKNGQVTANDTKSATPPIKREVVKPNTAAAPAPSTTSSDATGAIQIPGAHKSFLAPDGIPFIDEDVDDEIETGRPDGDSSSIPVVGGTVVVKPDVNKNVVKEPVSPSQPPAPQPIAPVKPPTVDAVAERRPDAQPTPAQQQPEKQQQQQQQPSEQDKSWNAAIDVLKSDLEFEAQPGIEQTSTHITEARTSVTVTTETTSTVNHEVEFARQVSDQQQQAAAIKIQAGIRGYRDRQRVRAIRAAKQSHADESTAAADEEKDNYIVTDDHNNEGNVPQSSQFSATVKTEEIVLQERSGEEPAYERQQQQLDSNEYDEDEDANDPKKERAAVKIQASYKGWKTRKELGKVKE